MGGCILLGWASSYVTAISPHNVVNNVFVSFPVSWGQIKPQNDGVCCPAVCCIFGFIFFNRRLQQFLFWNDRTNAVHSAK